MKRLKLAANYSLNMTGYIIYYGALLVVMVLIGLWIARVPIGLRPLYDHVSNLVISFSFLLNVGSGLLYKENDTKYIAAIGVVVVILNFGVETLVTFGNTRDQLDTIAGLVGVMLAITALMGLKRFGSRPKVVSQA